MIRHVYIIYKIRPFALLVPPLRQTFSLEQNRYFPWYVWQGRGPSYQSGSVAMCQNGGAHGNFLPIVLEGSSYFREDKSPTLSKPFKTTPAIILTNLPINSPGVFFFRGEPFFLLPLNSKHELVNFSYIFIVVTFVAWVVIVFQLTYSKWYTLNLVKLFLG